MNAAEPNRWPVRITFHHADGRTYDVVPPEHTVVDVAWDRKMEESPGVDHYCRTVLGRDVDVIISFRRTD